MDRQQSLVKSINVMFDENENECLFYWLFSAQKKTFFGLRKKNSLIVLGRGGKLGPRVDSPQIHESDFELQA